VTGDAGGATPTEHVWTISQYPEKLAIVRLGPGSDVPGWAESSSLFSVTVTATETSLVCATRSVPTKVPAIKPLTAFMVHGPLEPDLVGLLAQLLAPLAEAGITAFAQSTFDTDWLLIPADRAEEAAEIWRRRGHTVAPATPVTPGRS
jgi:hypothetical protein